MKWNFAEQNEFLDKVGFKDNDIEKFGQDPAKSIVREAIQNSCDALDVENGNSQVKVVIKKGTISKNELPYFSEIEEHIKNCLNIENDKAENQEIQRHIDAFETDIYTFLEISDYHTTGMDFKSFEGLTQGIFKSVKKTSGSQGSKGVGKAAYYANSYLRTMLTVTRSEEGLRYRGASKIASHINPSDNSKKLNYKGFYGDLALKEIHEIPSILRRTEKGTSIFIVGLWSNENIEKDIIREVLRNYWFAILRNQLVVTVLDLEINNVNIKNLMESYFEDFKDYKTGDKQNPRPYLQTVIKGKEYTRKIANIGECSLWLDNHEDYNLGAVARFRKTKMLIFKEKNLDSGFAGVFLCDNEEGNTFLKEIENDAHDVWNEKINPDYFDRAKVTLTEIKQFISESYSDYAGISNKDSFQIDALNELFNFSGGNFVSNKKDVVPRPKADPTEDKKDRILEMAKFSAFTVEDKVYYKLNFKSYSSKTSQHFKIAIGTDSSKDKINIIASSSGTFKENILILDVNKGENIIEKIELDVPFLVAPSIISINS